tara:strand:- start:181 stop:900 length:720 start_codon:yes stop_codon:yes gene_type:complete
MANSYGPKSIVTQGLIFAADAGNIQCYTSGSSTCTDLIGGFTGTLQGSGGTQSKPIYSSDGGGSWMADGADDEINFGTSTNVANLAGTANLTIGYWGKKDSSGVDCMAGAYKNSGTDGFYLQWYGGDSKLYFGLDNKYNTFSLSYTSDWYYFVGVYDGTQSSNADKGKIYINGVNKTLTSTTPIPSTISATVPEMIIGSMEGYSRWTDGKMTGVTIYNRSLTAAEILQNYNTQKSRFGL